MSSCEHVGLVRVHLADFMEAVLMAGAPYEGGEHEPDHEGEERHPRHLQGLQLRPQARYQGFLVPLNLHFFARVFSGDVDPDPDPGGKN